MDVIIDVHSHILPGLDDGALDLNESMQMLRMAYSQGVRQVIATPHYSVQFQMAVPERVRKLCRQVEEAARSRYGMKIRIRPGQEILYTDETAGLLKDGDVLTLADSRYVLVEFFPSVSYSTLHHAVRVLTMYGYLPVIAHAERYHCLREKGRLKELKEQGGYIQLNYRSVGGSWRSATTRWCRKVLKARQADFLGTDMHNTGSRCPATEEAVKWMESHLTRLYRRKLLYGNAQKLTADEKL